MRKGIWQEFDGYNEIVEEIELSFKAGKERSFDRLLADQYLGQLHPRELNLRVVDVVQETPTTKTLRLVPDRETKSKIADALEVKSYEIF